VSVGHPLGGPVRECRPDLSGAFGRGRVMSRLARENLRKAIMILGGQVVVVRSLRTRLPALAPRVLDLLWEVGPARAWELAERIFGEGAGPYHGGRVAEALSCLQGRGLVRREDRGVPPVFWWVPIRDSIGIRPPGERQQVASSSRSAPPANGEPP